MKNRVIFQIISATYIAIFLQIEKISADVPLVISSGKCNFDDLQQGYEYYGGEYYIFQDKFYTYDNAKQFCSEKHGKLPLLTDKDALREYIAEERTKRNHQKNIWLGREDSNAKNIHYIYTSQNKEVKASSGSTDVAIVICQCNPPTEDTVEESALKPDNVPDLSISETKIKSNEKALNFQALKNGNNSEPDGATNRAKKNGRIAPGGNDVEHHSLVDDSSFSPGLSAAIAIVAVGCAVGAAYGISKSRGWNIAEMVSRQMPYNREREQRPTEATGNYSPGQELVDMTSSNHRPIHVYEEIIPRGRLALQSPTDDMNCRTQSLDTFPTSPPPPLPLSTSYGNGLEAMNSSVIPDPTYLSPNNRGDCIPGDVRSPLPISVPAFKFPQNKKYNRMKQIPEKEIHYASVETVHTDLDDEKSSPGVSKIIDDEDPMEVAEYGAVDDSNEKDIKKKEKSPNENKNRYSLPPSRDNHEVEVVVLPRDPFSPSIQTRVVTNDYENGRFLKTIMKADNLTANNLENQTLDRSVTSATDSETIPSLQESVSELEPTYAKVNKKGKIKETSSAAPLSVDNSTYMIHVEIPEYCDETNLEEYTIMKDNNKTEDLDEKAIESSNENQDYELDVEDNAVNL